MRTIKRRRLENSNDVDIECNELEEDLPSKQSPINDQQQESSSPDDQNVYSVASPPSTTTTNETNNFKTPLPPVTNDHLGIRRKSNRILSLKLLNQNQQQQNSNLVTSSTSDHNDLQQAQNSECDQNNVSSVGPGQKPNQASDISSTAL
ncbi:hypothetical protein BLA29_009016 [Euroglyphus maynei]|uniref:Uncharacterized protein n=1 Tax=Euroglyphus maynei TaxID=6958 RepID=A0A1Y3B052_EURMA|nr:hypothetical protein BLA29_009016 [Euroglyphus maynei]